MPNFELRTTLGNFLRLKQSQPYERLTPEWAELMKAVTVLFENGHSINSIIRTFYKFDKYSPLGEKKGEFEKALRRPYISARIRTSLRSCPQLLDVPYGKPPSEKQIALFKEQFVSIFLEMRHKGYGVEEIVDIMKAETSFAWITHNHIWGALFNFQTHPEFWQAHLSGGRVKKS